MTTIPRSSPRDSQTHITSLDGVRGVAIILVLIVHLLFSNSQTGSRILDIVMGFRAAGWVGVDLFFALSGFLITGILFDTANSGNYFKNFYARRVLRIFPLYYATILLLFILIRPHSFAQARPLFVLMFYLQNTPLWWRDLGAAFAHNNAGHLWSLAVEEQFYLVWPIIVFWIRDRRTLMWTTLGIATLAPITRAFLVAHGAPYQDTYMFTICRADSLLGGAWLALAVRGSLRTQVLRYAPLFFAFALAVCALIAWKSGNFDWVYSRTINLYGYSVIAVGSTAFIAMALRSGSVVANCMRLGVLRFFGKYSYGIYVLHLLVNALVVRLFDKALHAHLHSRILYHLVHITVSLLFIVPCAMLSYHFFEQPFLKLKRYFNYPARHAASIPGPVTLAAGIAVQE